MDALYAPDTDEVAVALPTVMLGMLDLLVERGTYRSRGSAIRHAVERALGRHERWLERVVEHLGLELGVRRVTRAELEAAAREGSRLNVRLVGSLHVDADVRADVARRALGDVTVYGAIRASEDVLAVLASAEHARAGRALAPGWFP